MKLLRYDKPVATIFDLLGRKEDDMTYALGYVISRSPRFMTELIRAIGGDLPTAEGAVRLQTSDESGRTDVELEVGDDLYIVLEAKRGPELPSIAQLRRYMPRLKNKTRNFTRLVAVTNTPSEFARTALPASIDGVVVTHLTWREVRDIVNLAQPDETNHNKRLLKEFNTYLTGILGMEVTRSNMVYVLSLGAGGVWGLNFKEVALKHRRYFYPTKGHWPPPPNYLAFRYDGRLQSIHHVEKTQVFTNPHDMFKEAQSHIIDPHYLFWLGPGILPSREVRNGSKIMRAMRVWCMIDTLLTCETITEAWEETRRRLGDEGQDQADE
ncbi:hypothetical protein WME97_12120 [Sorangium sp. So ce367]|uniref:hypothetical protein n=1 Tax=Sorangium sp. So ce367 TaxID=3133305 RepID=UPI003F63F63C